MAGRLLAIGRKNAISRLSRAISDTPCKFEILRQRCPFLAQSGHHSPAEPCPLLGVSGHAQDITECPLLTHSEVDTPKLLRPSWDTFIRHEFEFERSFLRDNKNR
jgi:hypothetical protein